MQALADIPECNNYYELLQHFPETQSPPPGHNYVVFCPRNEAVESKLAAAPGSKIKRNYPQSQDISINTVQVDVRKRAARREVPGPTANPKPTAGTLGKRQASSASVSLVTVAPTTARATSSTAGDSLGGSLATPTAVAASFRTPGPDPLALDPNQLTLMTALDDPAFVNLGPGEAARIVSFGSPPTFANTNLKLSGGFGDVINIIRANIPFDLGIIHVADKYVSDIH